MSDSGAQEWDGDVLGRKKYSVFLTKYLEEKNEACVININAPWGHGKTFFIKHWYEDIKLSHPAIYFNAWENDFSNDSLLAIIACINKEIIPLLPASTTQNHAAQGFLTNSGKVLKKLAPLVIKGAIRKAIGAEGLEELTNLSTETEISIADAASKFAEELLSSHEAVSNSIKEFKTSVTKLIDEVAQAGDLKAPLFVFIDELDRCRPIYSIELLERVKHVFDMPNVFFIVATDTEQLSHSVKAIYGEGFNGTTYLRRFFDQIYTLPEPDCVEFTTLLFKGFTKKAKYFKYGVYCHINALTVQRNGWPFDASRNNPDEYKHTLTCNAIDNSELILLFALFARFFNLDLRTKKQCFDRFVAIERTLSESEELHFAYLIFLIMLDVSDSVLFKAFFVKMDIAVNSFNNNPSSENLVLGMQKEKIEARKFISLYVANVSSTQEQLGKRMQASDASGNSLNSMLLHSCYDNYKYLGAYRARVEMADALG